MKHKKCREIADLVDWSEDHEKSLYVVSFYENLCFVMPRCLEVEVIVENQTNFVAQRFAVKFTGIYYIPMTLPVYNICR